MIRNYNHKNDSKKMESKVHKIKKKFYSKNEKDRCKTSESNTQNGNQSKIISCGYDLHLKKIKIKKFF